VCYTDAEELTLMPYRRAALCLFLILNLLFAAPLRAAAQDDAALFQAAAAAWLSPKEAALQSGTYALHTGGSAFAPPVAPELSPYDAGEAPQPLSGFTFASSDEQIVSVDETGLMTGVSDGTATVACTAPDGTETTYSVTVSKSNLPEQAKAFVYVARREYLLDQKQWLPKANRYTKWYYRSDKEVGWCSVFTIWCANASGFNPIPEEDAATITDDQVLFLREGQVGNQYEGFARLNRFVGVPRVGYLVIYANLRNTYLYTHIGIVTDVTALSGGRYQVTTAEGNMSSTVKCYTYIYDSNLSNHLLTSDTRDQVQPNIFMVPEDGRTDPLTQYEPQSEDWTVFGFCATWL
jgi:hypothetical protein